MFVGTSETDAFVGTQLADLMTGAEGAGSLLGDDGDDTLHGDDGNDTLRGHSGHDSLLGGAGADYIDGADGDDTLFGGADADQLFGGVGNDLIHGEAGNDVLWGDLGHDTLDGGAGNDTINGGTGNNVYLFGIGDGQDRVNRFNDATAGKLNILRMKAGVLPSNVIVRQVYDTEGGSNWALEVSIAGTSDKITFNGFLQSSNPGNPYNPLQRIEFEDPSASNVAWSLQDIVSMMLTGSSGADTIGGTISSDLITGGAGNDTLGGEGGDDTLYGDDGNDTLRGHAGNDSLWGGAGADFIEGGNDNDTLWGEAGADTLYGGANNDTLWGGADADKLYGDNDADLILGEEGDDSLWGGAGNDTLDGGAGNDTLNGEAGNNVYLFGIGDGQDRVSRFNDTTAGKLNILRMKAGILPSDVTVRQVYDPENNANWAVEISIAGFPDKITFNGFMQSGNPNSTYNPLQRIEFEDPSASSVAWSLQDIVSMMLTGSSDSETLYGTVGDDTLRGEEGADTLRGDNGHDTLLGGDGTDRLEGGAGDNWYEGGLGNDTLIASVNNSNETYVWGRNHGSDNLSDSGGADQLRISDATTDQIWLRRIGNALEVSIIGSGDAFLINNWYIGAGNHNQVEQFTLADNKTLSSANVQNLVNAMAGFTPPANGQTTLPTNYSDALGEVISSNWV